MKRFDVSIFSLNNDAKSAALIYALLDSTDLHQIIKNNPYQVKNQAGEVVEVCLSHSLIRNIKSKKQHQRSFYVQGEVLGSNSKTKVTKLIGRILLEEEKQLAFYHDKTSKYAEKDTSSFDRHEGETSESFMLRSLNLGGKNIKENRQKERFSYLIKRAEGVKLSDFIDENNESLSVAQRYELSCAIINAYETQVFRKGIIHCDIKPDNIMIDWNAMTETGFKVEYIDPEFALRPTNNGIAYYPIPRGTPYYTDPDTYAQLVERNAPAMKDKPYEYSIANDMWALNLVLLDIWGVCDASAEFQNPIIFLKPGVVCARFQEIVFDKSNNIPRPIAQLFLSMFHVKQSERPSYDAWKQGWSSVELEQEQMQENQVQQRQMFINVVEDVPVRRKLTVNVKAFKAVFIGAAVILAIVAATAIVLTALYFGGFAVLALGILAGIKTGLTIGGFGIGALLTMAGVLSVISRAASPEVVKEAPKLETEKPVINAAPKPRPSVESDNQSTLIRKKQPSQQQGLLARLSFLRKSAVSPKKSIDKIIKRFN